MKEQDVDIPIEGTKYKMQGVLRGDYTSPVIILAHGLSGWMHETLMFNASRYFEKKGFATLRINLNGDSKDEIHIKDFGIHENALEIDVATDFVKQKGAKLS